MTPATGICRTCQRHAGEVPFNGMTLYGHIDPPHPSHRVRFVRLSPAARNAVPAATGQPEASHEEARYLSSLMTTGTRAASKGEPRTAVPSEATPSPARAGRVDAGSPRLVAPRSARAGEDRFWRFVRRGSADECWEWTGAKHPKGYGLFGLETTIFAHRAAYQYLVGAIAPGLHIDHLCRNRGCVNPAHLEAVTPAENNRRSRPFRVLPAACPKGHPYDEANTYRDRNGWRYCRSCHRVREANAYARQKVG